MGKKFRMQLGFSLIELLVVVAIISVLVALLLPALSKARDQAKMITCATHLKNLYQGFYMFAEANCDSLPPGATNSSDPNLNSWVPWVWRYIYPDNPWQPGDPGFYDRFTTGIFRCPVNPVLSAVSGGWISYAMNNSMSNFRIGQVVDPARKLLVSDGGPDEFDNSPGHVVFFFAPWAGRVVFVTYRHDLRAQVSALDGHIEVINHREMWNLYPTRIEPTK